MVISGNNLVVNGTTVEQADLINISSITGDIQTQLGLKAPLESPSFTGNVGIGTSSPTNALSIYGSLKRFSISDSTSNIMIGQWDGTQNRLEYAGKPFNIHGYGTNDFIIHTNDTERMRIDSSGNVGIGTNSPYAKIESYGNVYGGGFTGLRIRNNSSTSTGAFSQIAFSTANYYGDDKIEGAIRFIHKPTVWGDSTQSGDLTFWTGINFTELTERMRISSSGNVGIGTSSPQKLLDVKGGSPSTTLGQATEAIRINTLSSSSAIGQGCEIQFHNGNDTDPKYTQAAIRSTFDAYDSTNKVGGSLIFGTKKSTDATMSERMRIDSTGNIGIGTSSPKNILNLTKNNLPTTTVDTTNSIVLTNKNTSDNVNAFNIGGIFADTYRDVASNHYSAGIWFTRTPYANNVSSASDIVFGAGANVSNNYFPTEYMRLNSSGRLLLGTTNDDGVNTLQVNGGIKTNGYINNNGVITLSWVTNGAGNQSFDFIVNSQNYDSGDVMEITCIMNHYGYINGYGCARKSLVANGSGTTDIIDITNLTSGLGGSWTITRLSQTQLRIRKEAGTYTGSGSIMVTVTGTHISKG